MKNKFKVILSGSLLIAIMAFAISCKETFTEEDALKAQQEIDLAIYVVNGSDVASAPVAGATVTFSQNGVAATGTTDATGAALFPKIKVGDFVYTVAAANFITESGQSSASSTNFREGQVTIRIPLFSLTDADLATIKGTVTMEKDVTNLTREFAASIDVFFDVFLDNANNGIRTFTAKTDANGAYSIKVPTNPGYNTSVNIRYGDFEADQVIAVNKFSDEVGFFPTILPRKETMKTLFSMSTSGNQFRFFDPNDVQSLYGIVAAPPAGGTQAVISNVNTNSLGQITSVGFSNGGNYTGATTVNITFTSLDGGTGGSAVVTMGNQTSVANAYNFFGTGSSVTTGGTGYPVSTSGVSLNKIGFRDPTFRSFVNVLKGTVAIANGDYGTGIYRARQVE